MSDKKDKPLTIATFLDLADESIKICHGESLMPTLNGETESHRDEVFSEMGPKKMIRRGEWKYVYSPERGIQQLFNLVDDPNELNNLSGSAGVLALDEEEDIAEAMEAIQKSDGGGLGLGGVNYDDVDSGDAKEPTAHMVTPTGVNTTPNDGGRNNFRFHDPYYPSSTESSIAKDADGRAFFWLWDKWFLLEDLIYVTQEIDCGDDDDDEGDEGDEGSEEDNSSGRNYSAPEPERCCCVVERRDLINSSSNLIMF